MGKDSAALVDSKRVLLIEDNAKQAATLSMALSGFGCSVTHVGSLAQARRHLQGSVIDVAVIDIMLPDGNGLDFVQYLRTLSNPCAAVILTGSTQAKHLREAVSLGVTEYLIKPASVRAITEAIDRGVEQTRHMRKWVEDHPAGADLHAPVVIADRPAEIVRKFTAGFKLTDREAEALELVACGHRDRQIAETLHISYSRVRQLLAKAFGRLGLRGRNDFIRFLCERVGA